MAVAYDLIVDGTTYSLDDGTICYVAAVDGWGHPPLHRLSQRGPLQHGVTDLGFRLDPRDLALALDVIGSSGSDMEAKLADLSVLFAPSDDPVSFRYTREDGAVRQIDCHAVAGLKLGTGDGGPFDRRALVELLAPDPTFYEPTQQSATLQPISGGWAIPWAIPWAIGTSDLDDDLVVTYAGTWREHPVLRLYGPIADPVIANATTGEEIDLTGTVIAPGDWYELDLRPGYKTVVDSGGTNRLSAVLAGSDLATWHLQPGNNTISLAGTGGTANTRLVVSYYRRYTGVY